ncbi:MAG TPA: alpha/beta hydrolase [Polyangia bacterium]
MDGFSEFESAVIDTGETSIFARWAGDGPPVLLLHGFPQTHLMWRKVAPVLRRNFTVVCADLRGYGASGCPPSTPDHAPYSKRAMARDMLALMRSFGFRSFSVVGHDRGARVAYRLALDHPSVIDRVAILDAIPILDAWERADARLAMAFWPWSLLAQPAPMPERLVAAAPEAIIDDALGGGWGSPPEAFEADVREAYVGALRRSESVHAICEEYRAAASTDPQHDDEDRSAGRRIPVPVFVLWSERGPLGTWYAEAGGPLAIWRDWADDVTGHALAGGHFFAEELPETTARILGDFLAGR